MNNNINVAVGGPINADYPKVYKTKFLKPGIPFSLQVTEPDTKYVVKHDFDLDGGTVTIPEGCLLEFDGGSLNNGTVVGQKTGIKAVLIKIFDVTINGTWNIEGFYPEWFGAKKDSESTIAIQKCVDIAILCKKDVLLSTNYIVSNSIVITEKVNIIGNTDKYSVDNFTASSDFVSTTLNGYTCNAVLECRRPILLNRVGINGNSVANGIQWYEGYAEGSITKCYIHNCKSSCIIGSVVESFTIEDNYLAGSPIGIVFTQFAFTDNYSPTIFVLQRNNKTIGYGYMLYINRNVIQCYGIGIFLQGQNDVSITQNMTSHNQINGIWAKDCNGMTIKDCYSEGDGVCVGDGYTPVSGTEPAITTNQSLIDLNIDGFVYQGNAYRSPYFLSTCNNIEVRNAYVSYKKRGQSKTIDIVSTDRTDAGIDAIFTFENSYYININNITYKNWNNNYKLEATVFDANIYVTDLKNCEINTSNPQPINFINAFIANVGNCVVFKTNNNTVEIMDADDNNYNSTLSYNPLVYTSRLSDMPIIVADKFGKDTFFKFTALTDQLHCTIKNITDKVLTAKTYLQILLPVRNVSSTSSIVMTVTTYGGSTKTYTTKNTVLPNKLYNHRNLVPITSEVTHVDIGLSLSGDDYNNVLFGKLKAIYV